MIKDVVLQLWDLERVFGSRIDLCITFTLIKIIITFQKIENLVHVKRWSHESSTAVKESQKIWFLVTSLIWNIFMCEHFIQETAPVDGSNTKFYQDQNPRICVSMHRRIFHRKSLSCGGCRERCPWWKSDRCGVWGRREMTPRPTVGGWYQWNDPGEDHT